MLAGVLAALTCSAVPALAQDSIVPDYLMPNFENADATTVVRETSPMFLEPAEPPRSVPPPTVLPSVRVKRAAEMTLHQPGMVEDQGEVVTHHVECATPSNAFYLPNAVDHGPYRSQLDPFRQRAEDLHAAVPKSAIALPVDDFAPWWESGVTAPIGFALDALPVNVAGLTQTALVQSPLVQGVLAEPQIRQQDVIIENAAFDSLAFIEGKFADTSEPVGSRLTTGDNSTRFRDETLSSSAGLRKKSRSGGALELTQRGGFQENNSTFLIPNPQGTTRLEINYTQPLMRDRGRAVNQTRVVLAQLDLKLATNEAREDLESHLVDVTRAYWGLYQARAEWLQRKRLHDRAVELRDVLQARGDIDSQPRQILRSEAAVARRASDLIRVETRIRNLQARLRTLTGDPQLTHQANWELIPQDVPLALPIALSRRDATITALDNRTDITEAIRKIHAISARVGAARNQVLPRLDLILHSHLAGLDSRRDTLGAFGRQFSEGRPSYAAGLLYEMPFGNRAAKARLQRNRWEMSRALNEFQQTTEEAFTDVEVAVRETQTAFAEMAANQKSIEAADREVSYLEQRWKWLPDPNESAVQLIEDLLDAQERLADEEQAFVTAQVGYALSWVQVRKSMGILLRLEDPNSAPTVIASPQAWETMP